MISLVNGRTVRYLYRKVQSRTDLQAWRALGVFPARTSVVDNFLSVDTRGFVSERAALGHQ